MNGRGSGWDIRHLEILYFTKFFDHFVFTPNAENVLENRTFGCKRLKVLFLYHFLDGKALKIASIEEKIYKIREPSY